MAIIRPRLNDFYDLPFTQEEVDFAIPFLDEDIPLYVDPFLLWKSPSLQDNALHASVVNSFNYLGYLVKKEKEDEAIQRLIVASECKEVGLGLSKSKQGLKISEGAARSITHLFVDIPQLQENGFVHFEEIQLLVDNIAKDRISDITCCFLKSFLIDFTIDQCEKHKIPLSKIHLQNIYNFRKNIFDEEDVPLPQNPNSSEPILLVPKRWLRYIPWISYEDYYKTYLPKEVSIEYNRLKDRIEVLNFNRHNYDIVSSFTKQKELTQEDCKNDPLFTPIPIRSAKGKLSTVLSIQSGNTNKADKIYEDNIGQLMASLLYPHLDFAADQSRTEGGVLIRDLVFYNNRSLPFLKDIYDDYGSKQLVMELKNVKEVEREHINQLNRYLNDQFGKFGIIITRNRLPKPILRNTIDLWSGQRRCIIALTDIDISLMVDLFESKQRLPIEVIKRAYIEFMRLCPS